MTDEKKTALERQDADNAREDDKELRENDLDAVAGGCEQCGKEHCEHEDYDHDENKLRALR